MLGRAICEFVHYSFNPWATSSDRAIPSPVPSADKSSLQSDKVAPVSTTCFGNLASALAHKLSPKSWKAVVVCITTLIIGAFLGVPMTTVALIVIASGVSGVALKFNLVSTKRQIQTYKDLEIAKEIAKEKAIENGTTYLKTLKMAFYNVVLANTLARLPGKNPNIGSLTSAQKQAIIDLAEAQTYKFYSDEKIKIKLTIPFYVGTLETAEKDYHKANEEADSLPRIESSFENLAACPAKTY